MKLLLLTAVTMIAFAANSVLNRAAVDSGLIDPSGFALIRVISGALVLGMVLSVRRSGQAMQIFVRRRLVGALSLSAYLIGFSMAYVSLDAGLGALILFGTVQVTMFVVASLRGDQPAARQMIGAGIAFLGLLIALWPGGQVAATPTIGAAAMVFAGLGWAFYTLAGKAAKDPLAETAANFLCAVPFVALLMLGPQLDASFSGIFLAVLSGAVTSGLGYALWYAVLPQLKAQTAAVVQLSVPIIAIIGGAVLLGEAVALKVVLATVLVVCGIALAVTVSKSSQAGRS
ncbi:MAG: DMT family transporter [Rhodobacteraceae bacterium]|nr:DMT family transporter [Paracoccaceae bacterium]